MQKRRVVITGIGAVTPLGINYKSSWENLIKGKCGIDYITSFDASTCPVKIAGEVKKFSLPNVKVFEFIPQLLPRAIQFIISAINEALEDANLNIKKINPFRVGICMGATINSWSMDEAEEWYKCSRSERLSPESLLIGRKWKFIRFFHRVINMASCIPALIYNIKGDNLTIDTACAASAQAIGEAFRIIQRGDVDIVIAGGGSSLTDLFGITAFTLLGALSRNKDPSNASRPFDAKRDGFVMAEGGGIVILEELSLAVKRRAKIYAELVGYGCTANAYRLTDSPPDGTQEARAMKLAINEAIIEPWEVDYINSHGTSTKQNDRSETLAIKKTFGTYAFKIPVSSNKAQLGHSISAAGVLSLIFTVLAMHNNVVPPTMNYKNYDPSCNLDYVPNEPREREIKVALVNAFAFGGHNATLVVKVYEQ